MRTQCVVAFAVAALFAVVAPAAAQAPPPAQTPPAAKTPPPAPPPAQAPAAAQASSGGGWSVSFDVGMDSSMKGDVYSRGNGTLSTMPVQLSARTYARAYGPGIAWSVAIGRSLSDRTELRIRVGGSNASGEREQTGRVGTGDVTGTLFSEVDKLMEIGVDVGLRLYFRSGASVQPYLGAQVGFARVSAMAVALDVPDAIFAFQENLNLYSDSTAVTGGGNLGLLFNRSDAFGIYVNLDLRFRGKLKADDGELAGTNFEPINNASSRVSTPLSVGARVRF